MPDELPNGAPDESPDPARDATPNVVCDATSNAPVWDDAPAPALAPLDGLTRADACVVGLGGSGLAAVHALLDLGLDAVGLDAGRVASGAAGRNGGFLLAGLAAFHHDAGAAHGRARARRLYAHTVAAMDAITAETPDAVRRVGSLRVAASPEERDDCRAHLAALQADGFAGAWYAGPEGEGLLIPTDGAFQPLARARARAARAVARGARLHEGTPVLALGDGVVRTPSGEVHADAIVVAVDGRLDVLLPELAGRVRTARLQMLATAPAPDVRGVRPVYRRWGYDYWQQRPDGGIALGGCRDRFEASEWTADATPTAPVQAALDAVLRDVIGTTAPVTHRWAASVGYSASGLPVLDEVRPGVWACGGYSGTGNVVGWLCGRAAARHAAGRPTRDDAELRDLLAAG